MSEKAFFERVVKTEECWLWTGASNGTGYGRFWDTTRLVYPHRWAYEHFVGPIPENLCIDHLCRNRSCVNPDHLEAVSQKENIARGEGLSAINAQKTHCLRGHEFTEKNTRLYRGKRHCRACNRDRERINRARRKA